MDITRMRKPRCYLLYAVAPEDMPASDANQLINQICGDHDLPLTVYHDHFIGQPGGLVIFYAETDEEREALQTGLEAYLAEWTYALHPLIFSYSPAAFDEQIAFTLSAYRDSNWDALRRDKRPAYGNPREEAETARES
ncbi:MAG: hypothetical protein L0154_09945 [Chloroflexi bacterium]|nr:hypothetical protein [Chloroflexota bacterium]